MHIFIQPFKYQIPLLSRNICYVLASCCSRRLQWRHSSLDEVVEAKGDAEEEVEEVVVEEDAVTSPVGVEVVVAVAVGLTLRAASHSGYLC